MAGARLLAVGSVPLIVTWEVPKVRHDFGPTYIYREMVGAHEESGLLRTI